MAKKSKKQKSGVGTLILLLFASLILMIVTGYLAVCGYMGMGTGEMPSVFGTSLYVVQNDVDRVPSGSAIITDRTASGFEVGDPIVFYNPALETDNKIMFQYISEIDGDIYKTVNAANENPVDVSGNMLRGLAVSFTPFVGTVLTFAQTTTGTIIFIVVTIILIALFIYAFYQLFFGRRKRKKAASGEGRAGADSPESVSGPQKAAVSGISPGKSLARPVLYHRNSPGTVFLGNDALLEYLLEGAGIFRETVGFQHQNHLRGRPGRRYLGYGMLPGQAGARPSAESGKKRRGPDFHALRQHGSLGKYGKNQPVHVRGGKRLSHCGEKFGQPHPDVGHPL